MLSIFLLSKLFTSKIFFPIVFYAFSYMIRKKWRYYISYYFISSAEIPRAFMSE